MSQMSHSVGFAKEQAESFLYRPGIIPKEAFKKPLITVVAGAGYGKTQAVLAALHEAGHEAAWLTLSSLDNYMPRLLERIARVFLPFDETICENLRALGFPASIAAFNQMVDLIEKFTKNRQFVLVLDDFHFIENQAILDFLSMFISAHVERFSLVLVSRKKPDLSLVQLLSRGELYSVSEDALRFSKHEMDAYFQKLGIRLGKRASGDIYAYTDGWILAIYLVGLAIGRGHCNAESPILATRLDIFDLMEKEIFSSASENLQGLLMKIALLGAVPSSLLKFLAGGDLSLLSELMKSCLFVRYDASSDSYCIHQLFRAFLLEQKGGLGDKAAREVYLLAAKWHEKKGRKSEAIDLYRKCGCYHEIFDIILTYTYHTAKETADLFISLIDAAPQEVLDARPIMRVVRANYMFNNNRISEAKDSLLALQAEYEAGGDLEILGEIYTSLALIAIVQGDGAFVSLFKKADALLPRGSRLFNYKLHMAEGLNVCSIKDPAAGSLMLHKEALFQVAPYAERVMNGSGYGTEYLNAAEANLYTGDLREAERYAYEAIYRSKQYLQYDIEYMANFVLVRVFLARGNYEKIVQILHQMKNQLKARPLAYGLSLYHVICGWFYTKIGQTRRIAKWIRQEEVMRKSLAPVHVGREYLVRSDCLMAEERYFELLALMEQTDRLYAARGILFAIIQNKISRAIIHHYMGNRKKSIIALSEAYALSSPNDLTMQYIEYGNKMRTLVHAARQNEACEIPREWLNMIYTKSSSYAKMLSRVVSAYNSAHALTGKGRVNLSKRETEVLRHLYQGFTREEIATTCYLSLSTVNGIIKNIYDKLGAVNAADAVRIAKENQCV